METMTIHFKNNTQRDFPCEVVEELVVYIQNGGRNDFLYVSSKSAKKKILYFINIKEIVYID